MATKGERTRAEIVRRSAELMNRQGFLSAPMAAVVAATGIQKGGLYRHFESREALAYEALDYAIGQVRQRFMQALAGHTDACARLLALLAAYDDISDASRVDLPFPGGCPIMNCAIESDHAHPGLRLRAQQAMSGWQGLLQRIVADGLQAGQIRHGVDPRQVATVFTACIEGAVMLTHLQGDPFALQAARDHLAHYVEHQLRPLPGAPA